MDTLISEKPIQEITIQSLSGTEQVVKVDASTAIKYTVVEEKIDLNALEAEKAVIETTLPTKEPTEKELLELARKVHPFYNGYPQQRIKQIDEILNTYGSK